MKGKLFIIFFTLVLLPTLALGYSNYLRTTELAYRNINNAKMQTLVQINYNIHNTIEYATLVSDSLYFDEEIKKFLGTDNNSDIMLQLKQLKNIRNKIHNYEGKNHIYKVRLFVDDQKMASTEHVNFFSVNSIKDKEWYSEITDLYGAALWSGVNYEVSIAGESDSWLISYHRVIKNTNNIYDNNGILSVDITEAYLYSLMDDVSLRKSERIFIIDDEGRLLSGADKSILGQEYLEASLMDKIRASEQDILQIGDIGQEEYLVYTTIKDTGWIVVDRIARKNMLEGYSFWRDLDLIILTILVIILFVAASFVIINNIMNEIMKRMSLIAEKIENEGIKAEQVITDQRVNRKDDMGKVEEMVYSMIERSNQLSKESYESRLEERKAQLMALQAQINPHFLYNTLENINWMAIRKNAPEISSLVTTLAKYFRLSLNKGKILVSIEDEIELIKTYLAIQNARFDGGLDYEINIDPECKNYSIPKLTLQPIVENSVLHGILKKPEKSGNITIETQFQEDELLIIITDNGVGMEQERVAQLLNSQQSSHYGLFNVQERLKLYYGEKYGMRIASIPGQGTTVTLHLGKINNTKVE
ncbi:MAG: histidine kinase [Herbinix sp.]|nr:histidine kinase [Herbinix sp.]